MLTGFKRTIIHINPHIIISSQVLIINTFFDFFFFLFIWRYFWFHTLCILSLIKDPTFWLVGILITIAAPSSWMYQTKYSGNFMINKNNLSYFSEDTFELKPFFNHTNFVNIIFWKTFCSNHKIFRPRFKKILLLVKPRF